MTSIEDNEEIEASQTSTQPEERSEDDIFSILLATDLHLGFAEKDPIRSKDTFDTFEEILQIAQEQEVDFILLGGDLFHETRPSTYSLFKCTELLKKYCLGGKPVQIEFLSDPSHNFSFTCTDSVNYEDPNLNIALPVFSIHGNHDDPTGEQQISALDLLSSTGLVNYFGRYNNFTSIDVEPILLKKGKSKLALYGLSHIKDERLGRMFLDKKVTVMSPPGDDWFHLMVLHQNRANRGAKTFIPDDCMPNILDLVVWGHEHDCRITPEQASNSVFITQPGSSVATSLCIGESIPKHVGVLQIHKKKFNLTPISLKTVRPFVFKDILLKRPENMHEDLDGIDDGSFTYQAMAEKITDLKIEEMIAEAEKLGQREKMLPLLRLNVAYVDENQMFNTIRMGQKYVGRVANPKDMIKLKCSLNKTWKKNKNDEGDFMVMEVLPSRVEDLVLQYFENNPQKEFKCLSLKSLNESVKKCIDTSESDAITDVVNYFTGQLRKKLDAELVDIDKVQEFVANYKEQEDADSLVDKILNTAKKNKKKQTNKDDEAFVDTSGSESESSPTKANMTAAARRGGTGRPTRGPGSRGGRGSRGPRGGRGK